ncbi:MAG: Uncharacterized protein G01um101420_332 [Parcubacteria group bacterium Gr01-1014_20]|nr:MAG: Uncharacterized protein G01um101420_332 [Parcubacteria group bacterium Gr01-1014_20]
MNPNILVKISKIFLYAALFSVVIVLPSTFFPFIGGKYYFFRLAVEFALASLILFWGFFDKSNQIWERLKKVSRQPIFLAVSIFAFIGLLASLFAFDPLGAFWSNFERGEGGFQLLHYYIFFVLLTVLFREWKDWKWALRLSLAAAALLILYGVFAQLGCSSFDLDQTCWISRLIGPYGAEVPPSVWGRLTIARFQGTLGNPSYVAPYLMFSLFYATYLWFNRNPKAKALVSATGVFLAFSMISSYFFITTTLSATSSAVPVTLLILGLLIFCGSLVYGFRKREPLSLFYGFLIWCFTFFLTLSQTRGAILGLFVSTLVLLFYLVFFLPRNWKRWTLAALSVFVLAIAGLYYYRQTPLVSSLPGGRVLELFDQGLKADSVQTRLWTWGSAWKGFKERPILGWGQENFSTVFDRHFDSRHYKPGKVSETWFDRAHSVFFDYLTETGILGLLSYMVVFIVFYWQLFKHWHKRFDSGEVTHSDGKPYSNVVLRGLFITLPIAYLVQALALFDVLPVYINLFLFLAFASHQFNSKHEPHS